MLPEKLERSLGVQRIGGAFQSMTAALIYVQRHVFSGVTQRVGDGDAGRNVDRGVGAMVAAACARLGAGTIVAAAAPGSSANDSEAEGTAWPRCGPQPATSKIIPSAAHIKRILMNLALGGFRCTIDKF